MTDAKLKAIVEKVQSRASSPLSGLPVFHGQTSEPLPISRAPEEEAASLMQVIARTAADPRCDLDRMERLLAMRERMEKQARERELEERERVFFQKLADAQGEMRVVLTDKDNQQTRSKYASYAALDRMARPIYTKHGFALTFSEKPAESPDWMIVSCRIHNSGFSRDYDIHMPADGKGAKGGDVMTKTHAIGSAAQYGMRYLLKMIFNIATSNKDDDDGNAAGAPTITDEQVDELRALIVEVGADIPRFARYMKVERIEDIPAKDLPRAVSALKAKAAKQ